MKPAGTPKRRTEDILAIFGIPIDNHQEFNLERSTAAYA